MKAFTFRLAQALRWREAQVQTSKSRVAAAAAHASGISATLDARRAEVASGAEQIVREPTGIALAAYAGFLNKSRVQIRDLEKILATADRAFESEMQLLVDANRKLRLLENLERTEENHWRKEFDRELAAFADESFLCRQNPKVQSQRYNRS